MNKYILARTMARITGHPRYLPAIKWSNKSWTHNVFRLYESIFGRRVGIRKENSTIAYTEKGKTRVIKKFYTFESRVANLETIIREGLNKITSPLKFRILVPVSPVGAIFAPQFLFSIAIDNQNSGTGTASFGVPFTFSHTNTGSNLTLVVTSSDSNNQFLSGSYNSVSMTTQERGINSGTGIESDILYLASPATGSNTVSISENGTNSMVCGATSFTGTNTASPLDGSGNNNGSGTSQTVSVTTSKSNTYIVAVCGVKSGGGTFTAGQTQWYQAGSFGVTVGSGETFQQSSPGTKSMSWTTNVSMSFGNAAMGVAELVTTNSAFLLFMPN